MTVSVLHVIGHVIGYASRTLTPAETRYCITRRELLGVIFGLKKYRQQLLGRPIIVRTDHAALAYLMSMPEPVGQQGRWLDLLGEYDITIQHRPGRVHGNSDALPRHPCKRTSEGDCRQCLKVTSMLMAVPISCSALSADGSTVLPTSLRFPPRSPLGPRTYSSTQATLTLHPTCWRRRYSRFRRATRITRPRRMTPQHRPKCLV